MKTSRSARPTAKKVHPNRPPTRLIGSSTPTQRCSVQSRDHHTIKPHISTKTIKNHNIGVKSPQFFSACHLPSSNHISQLESTSHSLLLNSNLVSPVTRSFHLRNTNINARNPCSASFRSSSSPMFSSQGFDPKEDFSSTRLLKTAFTLKDEHHTHTTPALDLIQAAGSDDVPLGTVEGMPSPERIDLFEKLTHMIEPIDHVIVDQANQDLNPDTYMERHAHEIIVPPPDDNSQDLNGSLRQPEADNGDQYHQDLQLVCKPQATSPIVPVRTRVRDRSDDV